MANTTMRGGRQRKFKAEINVVPYIDVMLVLLVIFMVVSPMVNPSMIDLPTAGKSALPPPEYIQISLKPEEAATIGIVGGKSVGTQDKVSGRDELVRRLRDLHGSNEDMAVMIAADKNIKYDEVIQVVSEAKKMGFKRVGLATR
ncbi:ExbD/TolR family protein [Noviherbaspirillum pedocola]|uniref:ExbD/TolR family protein n=1 Tax=Noviherbaspirillum pedocola TaxID=2801341 RepID=A0A934SQG3_9BURK|nr:ExbD/TolR family protein [Noviherbaspirillum pedocola]MBK4733610.1 ExbD/TolR family protein [Noviherbaspirillum pedocola]